MSLKRDKLYHYIKYAWKPFLAVELSSFFYAVAMVLWSLFMYQLTQDATELRTSRFLFLAVYALAMINLTRPELRLSEPTLYRKWAAYKAGDRDVEAEIERDAEQLAKELGVTAAQLRFYAPPVTAPVMCNTCVHRQAYKMRGTGCAAYPDGIPPELIRRGEHDTPYPGDHGIRYQPFMYSGGNEG